MSGTSIIAKFSVSLTAIFIRIYYAITACMTQGFTSRIY